MIRRHDGWAKWIPAPADSSSTLKPQTSSGQLLEKSAYDSSTGNGENKKEASTENVEPSPNGDKLVEHLPLNNSGQESNRVLINGGSPVFTGGDVDSIGKFNSEFNSTCSDLATNYSTCTDHLQGPKLVKGGDRGTEGTKMSSDVPLKNIDDLSNDFSNTFLLDEEMELEQKTVKKDDHSSVRRY